ncbi:MAG: ATP-binding cassette domain-containing protein [Ignavibacteriae bacterium]|nr:ATP-binding cassette domain-containing protein [Ignavibacteriota bacterium]
MISYKNISLKFEDKLIFEDFSFEIAKGDKAALKGRSGSGKTSLLNLAMGFLKPDKGKIYIDGKELNGSNIKMLRKQMCWLPQSIAGFNSDSVLSMLEHPFTFHLNRRNSPSRNLIESYLNQVNLGNDILNQELDKVSGGEKQRLGLIICKLLKRKIIFLDEPTSALDKESLKSVAEFIMKDPEMTVLSASHDDEWLKYCDKIIEL